MKLIGDRNIKEKIIPAGAHLVPKELPKQKQGDPIKRIIPANLEDLMKIEQDFRKYGGFHENGFPKRWLSETKKGFKALNSGIYSEDLFSYLIHLYITNRQDKSRKIEQDFRKYSGFYDNNFPKKYLAKTKDGFEVRDSYVVSSSLFSYLVYLDLTNRQKEAKEIEQDFRKYSGFYDNNFPKEALRKTEDDFEVFDSDVASSSLFSYLIHLYITNRQDKSRKIEQDFRKYSGFYDNNFPKKYLRKTKDGFEVGDSDVVSSSLFSYLIYLNITGRQDIAMGIEQDFRKYSGFHENGFPKWRLSETKDGFEVGDSDVSSWALFSYLNYKAFNKTSFRRTK